MKFGEGFVSFVRASFVVKVKNGLLFTHLSSKILPAEVTLPLLSTLHHVTLSILPSIVRLLLLAQISTFSKYSSRIFSAS